MSARSDTHIIRMVMSGIDFHNPSVWERLIVHDVLSEMSLSSHYKGQHSPATVIASCAQLALTYKFSHAHTASGWQYNQTYDNRALITQRKAFVQRHI